MSLLEELKIQRANLKKIGYRYLREQESGHDKLDSLPKAVLSEMVRELWKWRLDNES